MAAAIKILPRRQLSPDDDIRRRRHHPEPTPGPDRCYESDVHPTILTLLDACPDTLTRLKQVHARMLRLGLISHPYSASRLVSACCGRRDHLHYALRVFDQIPTPNLYTWNLLIRAHASSDPELSLLLVSRMLRHSPHSPDKFTYPFAVKAASEMSASREGRAVHGMVVKSPFRSDVYILNSLVHFYAACGFLDLAYQLFVRIPERDVVSWNSMITALAQAGRCDEALVLFREMEEGEDVRPNDVTMVGALCACGKKGDLEFGRWIHSYIERNGIEESLILWNAVLDMYTKCGSLEDAKTLFEKMPEKDSVSRTTMLVGYARSEGFDAARRAFNEMPSRDIASWNALISAYEQSGRPKEALDLFHEALVAKARPDQVTLVAALSACSQLGAIDLGCWIHAYMKKKNFKMNFHLTTSLIDMYSKCGDLEKALEVFGSIDEKDVFVWSAMVAGLAMHGQGKAAIDLFLQMQEAKVKPNAVTFINILSACSHAGLVDQGKFYFARMLPVYGIEPKIEHYGGMVDILARSGRFEEAMDLIEKMPMPPHASIWGAMLGACVVHRKVKLGEHACDRLLELEPRNDGAYVLLSNLRAKSGNWDGVARLRKLMKDCGIKKEPGRSSMEVDGVVHEFLVGDISHPLSDKIYSKLDEITSRLKSLGHVPDRAQLLQDVEEEEGKEKALYLHSEKLAMAFGLIGTAPPTPIRITKNLRVCDDCHSVAKLISKIYDREILLRDRYRFHHFKGGHCSCMDYW